MKKYYIDPAAEVMPIAYKDIIAFSASENLDANDDGKTIEEIFGENN